MKKTIQLTFRKKTINFTFDIIKETNSFYIYIKNTPDSLERYGCHEAHYYGHNGGKVVCWSDNIRSFKDANAIMFQWARNFRDSCMRQKANGSFKPTRY